MKLTILGSGSFVSNLDHLGPGYLLEIGKKKILIDAGCGVQIQLLKLGIKIEDLDYIFITHLHIDHTNDLCQLHIRYRQWAKKYKWNVDKLNFIGPSKTEKFIYGIYKSCGFKHLYKPEIYKIHKALEKIDLGNIGIKIYRTKHMTGTESWIYRFEEKGKSIVFTGDTIKCSGIVRACKNADIVIADCSFPKSIPNSVHWSTTELGNICQQQKVKKIILSHLKPETLKYDVVSEVKEKFDGKVILAQDLMRIKL